MTGRAPKQHPLDPRSAIPSVDAVLLDERFTSLLPELGRERVKGAIREVQSAARAGIIGIDEVVPAALQALRTGPTSLVAVINATGVVLHTNLGRAPLSAAAVSALATAAGYVDVEFDLRTATRAGRGRATLQALRTRVPRAQDALVVNNGAAALILAVTALSSPGRAGVVVSRGELVEIGDGFRLPELMTSTGASIVEVGTTNRTTVHDYAAAIGPGTACIVKVHPSNFRIQGFTAEASVRELASLSAPLVVDIGSGMLGPDPLLPEEPDADTTLAAGADLVLCSADKLLGGPQAGLLLGNAELIGRLRRHPLARALRVDKLTLAALEATLAGPPTPTSRFLHVDAGSLRRRVEDLAQSLPQDIDADVVPVDGAVGGGGAPGLGLPGWAVSLPERYAAALRNGDPPVVGRLMDGRCLLDLRCVDPSQDATVQRAIVDVAASSGG